MQALQRRKLKEFLFANLQKPHFLELYHRNAKIVFLIVLTGGAGCFLAHSVQLRNMNAKIIAWKIFNLAVLCHVDPLISMVTKTVVIKVSNVLVVVAVYPHQLLWVVAPLEPFVVLQDQIVALVENVVQVLFADRNSHVVQPANPVYLVKPLAALHQIRFAVESSVALRTLRDVEALLDAVMLEKLLVDPDVVLPHRCAYLVNVLLNA